MYGLAVVEQNTKFDDTPSLRDQAVATPASTALNRDTPCLTGVHRNVAPVVSFFF